jgi:hypothetical protein
MFNRRRQFLAITVLGCLLVVSSAASADPLDTFAASSLPTHVKPSTSVSYTIKLTTNPSAPDRAQRATIGIPSGFTVDPVSVHPTTSAVTGLCEAATWVADGELIANGKINLKRPGGNPTSLCPGETLTVVFLATSAVADGAYTWTSVLLRDVGDSFTLVGPQPTVVVDGTAPTVTVTGPPNPTNATSASLEFAASEPSTFRCKLDDGAFAACTSPHRYTGLANGSHTFVVEATDALGDAAEASHTWTVDLILPIVSIIAKPTNPSNIESPTFAFAASEASSFVCRLDQEISFTPCGTSKSYSNLDDGLHTFAVRAIDAAGNTGAPASYPWRIDTIEPAVTITLKPGNPSSTSSPTFAFTASESGTFNCRLDGSGLMPCTSPTTYSLNDGPHTFAVSATDSAGNTGPEATHTWTIESRAPTAALTSTPSGLSNNSAATFVFSADEPSSFECALDERGFEPCSSPATFHALGDGRHAFSVRARDAVGNFSAAVSHAWAIDTTAPETTLASAPKSGTTATSAILTFSASENGSFECRLDGAPFALCVSPKSYTGLGEGDHRFEVRAIDAAGNADATPALHAWKIQAPVRIARSALLAPRGGARVTKPPLLVWRRVARAGYYNVQLFRGKQKILSAWPTRTRLRLRARWKFSGRVRRLTPGAYRWYVWPGYGVPSARKYGQLLGQSTFVVARSVRR